jgi:hypothetical protein
LGGGRPRVAIPAIIHKSDFAAPNAYICILGYMDFGLFFAPFRLVTQRRCQVGIFY